MRFIPADAEADDLLEHVTKLHCFGIMWGDEIRVTNNPDDIRKAFSVKGDTYFVWHNVFGYDAPMFKKVLGIDLPLDNCICTLGLSQALFPKNPKHGLEWWGEKLGVKKPEVEDWKNLTQEQYEHRLKEDVKIQALLWDKLWGLLLKLYDSDQDKALAYAKYISFKMRQLADQETHRVPVDKSVVEANLAMFHKIREEKWQQLIQAVPPVEQTSKRVKPKVYYKKDGSLSAHAESWEEVLKKYNLPPDTEEFDEVVGTEPFNPNSVEQTKDWLFSLGWNPCTYAPRKNKAGEINQVPQVTDSEGNLTPSVERLVKVEPAVEMLEGLGIIKNRIGTLKGILSSIKDGHVVSMASGFTKTLRLTHKKPIANLPKVSKKRDIKDGYYIRGCVVAKRGQLVCGSDMSSLEDKMKQEYIYKYDPQFVREMDRLDWDAHLDLAERTGALTKEQVAAHKAGTEDHSEVRSIHKTAVYTLQFGAGVPRLASTLGVRRDKAKQIHAAYWERNWAIKAAAKDAKIKEIDGNRWLLNPINGYYYYLSNDKDVFSSWCQSGGAYVVDIWIYFMRKNGLTPSMSYHDEVLIVIDEGAEAATKEKLLKSIAQTNKMLNLNIQLTIDIKFGESYAEVH